jgi:hypothetical protein
MILLNRGYSPLPTKTFKSRYFWIDIIKAIGILGVVYIHAPEVFLLNLNGCQLLIPTIYFRFGVPLFVIISFFLGEHLRLERSLSLSTFQFWKKRLPRLFLPYIVWSVFYFAFEVYRRYPKNFQFSLTGIWAGQYYLVVLLQLTILFPFLYGIKITPKRLMLVGTATFLFSYLPFSYFLIGKFQGISKYNPSFGFYWLFYLLFALYVAREYELVRALIKRIKLSVRLSLLFGLPLLFCGEDFLLQHLTWFLNGNLNPYLRLSTLVVSSLMFLLFIDLDVELNKLKIKGAIANLCDRSISTLSTWTLGIYCLNPFVILLSKDILENFSYRDYVLNLPLGVKFLLPMLIMLFVCSACVALSQAISRLHAKALVR